LAQQGVHCLRGVMHYRDNMLSCDIVTILYDLCVLYRFGSAICHVVVEIHNSGVYLCRKEKTMRTLFWLLQRQVWRWTSDWTVQQC